MKNYERQSKNSRTNYRTSNDQYAPLSSRNHEQDIIQQIDFNRQSTSRQFKAGMFRNKLEQKAEKVMKRNNEPQIELQIEQLPMNHSTLKSRGSNKKPIYGRDSNTNDNNIPPPNDYEEQLQTLKDEIENIKFYMSSNVSRDLKMAIRECKQVRDSYSSNLETLVKQINQVMQKKQESILKVKSETQEVKGQLMRLKYNFGVYSKDNEEKMENLMFELSSLGGIRKSKAHGQCGVDLMSSLQGMQLGSSIAMNGAQNYSKMLHEFSLQIQNLKKELGDNNNEIEQLKTKLDKTLTDKNVSNQKVSDKRGCSLNEQDILRLIRQKLRQQKRSFNLQQRLNLMEKKMIERQRVSLVQEGNIKGMNDEFSHIVNDNISPKIKKIEYNVNQLTNKLDSVDFESKIKNIFINSFNEKIAQMKITKIRNPTKTESEKLAILSGINEDKISYKQTYLLDEQNYLLDSYGTYLVQEQNGLKKKIKVDADLIYLMQVKGIQISGC